MRCVWLKAVERSRRLPWAEEIHDLRPPVDNRLEGTSSWVNLALGATSRRRRGGMSRLEDALAAGRFVVTAGAADGRPGGLDAVHERFAPYEDYVDATNATDNTAAHAHASPLAVAIALKQLGMEPVMQLICRDRNRLALEADIAGAALHGIENICCLTGDDVTAGDEPEARRVFDLDSIQLLATGQTMASRHVPLGPEDRPRAALFLGAVENPGAPPYDYRVDRALKKVRAGARFLQLQVCVPAASSSSASSPRRSREGSRAVRDPPLDLPRRGRRRRCASSTSTCRASRCRPR